jgi:phosphoribosylanthranilate isomerase
MVRIKICGVTTPEAARQAADAGADAVGLNFYPQSPRYVPPARAASLVRALPAFTAPVGVFVGTPMRQACAIAFQLGLRALQTYDDAPPSEDPFPFAHVPAFRVKEEADLDRVVAFVKAATAAGRAPSAVLVDSHVAGAMGGTGHRAPWELLAGWNPGVPLILAGGLTPHNVGEAVAFVRPWGVDVASGVESAPGVKDAHKVAQFVKSVRDAERALFALSAPPLPL